MDITATIKELKELFELRNEHQNGGPRIFWQHDEDRIMELSEAMVFWVESRGLAN